MLRPAVTFCLLLSVATGCREAALRPIEEGLVAEPERLVFAPTWVGHPTSAQLQIGVPGRVSLDVDIDVPAPFRVETPRVRIHAGTTIVVPVEFAPETRGVHQVVATISSGPWRLEVPLDGVARAIPSCVPSDGCEQARFDPVSGQCVRSKAPNGTQCTLPCVSNSVCLDGACVGTPTTCDDANACTSDACDAAQGCIHQAVQCAEPTDPCRAASCDPVLGCTSTNVADGTRCGVADCRISEVCISGACVARPTPEGGACQVSPCAGPGVCRSGMCDQPTPMPLEPAWVYQAPMGTALHVPGVMDPDGNHYWLECLSASCVLTSVAHDGALRGRWTLEHTEGVGSAAAGTMILARDLLVLTHAADWVEARRLDGSLAWERNLLMDLLPDFRQPSSERRVVPYRAVFDGLDQVVVRVSHAPTMDAGEGCWIVALDVNTAALRWKRHYPHRCTEGLVAAADGNVVFGTYRQVGSNVIDFHLRALDRGGTELWARGASNALPAAALGNLVLEQDTTVTAITSGSSVYRVFPSEQVATFGEDPVGPLLDGNTGYVMRAPSPAVGYTLDAFSLSGGALQWSMGLPMKAPHFAHPILTRAGNVLVAGSMPWSTMSRIREVSSTGELVFECPLGGAWNVSGVPSLHAGRWVVPIGTGVARGVAAYDLPGRDPAASGWSTLGGSLSRSGLALP